MRLRQLAFVLCLLLPCGLTACARETPAEHAASTYAAQQMAAAPRDGNLPDYSLPPAKLARADQLASIRTRLHFGGEAWGILASVLLLWLGAIAWMRDAALRLTCSRWLQAYVFLLLFLLARVLLNLPLSVYGHHVSLQYGLSIERWGNWSVDVAKSLALEWLVGGALLILLFFVIRVSPRRWWLWFWAAAVPIALLGLYITPLLIDPLYDHFEPLARTQPALVVQLEHMGVPASRQFLMKASAKVTTPNAYVTGLAGSKRIVVWDTSVTAGQSPSPEVLWMVGHECGHFVLHHVLIGTLLSLAGTLPLLWLGYLFVNTAIARFGSRWRISAQGDWGALAILLLAVALINTATEPIENTVSRTIEHSADIYGQEAIHGLVPDPQAAVLRACDQDGERAFDDPNPSPLLEFWTYNHPSTGRRAAFGKAYNPWAPGMQPKYFKK